MKKEYFRRIIDNKIEKYLDSIGAIYIKGPKWCGKTTSASRISKSMLLFTVIPL